MCAVVCQNTWVASCTDKMSRCLLYKGVRYITFLYSLKLHWTRSISDTRLTVGWNSWTHSNFGEDLFLKKSFWFVLTLKKIVELQSAFYKRLSIVSSAFPSLPMMCRSRSVTVLEANLSFRLGSRRVIGHSWLVRHWFLNAAETWLFPLFLWFLRLPLYGSQRLDICFFRLSIVERLSLNMCQTVFITGSISSSVTNNGAMKPWKLVTSSTIALTKVRLSFVALIKPFILFPGRHYSAVGVQLWYWL